MKRGGYLRSDPAKTRAWQQRSRSNLKRTASGRARPADPLATWCELDWPHDCEGRAAHRHHRRRRAQGGTDDRENTMDLCRAGHEFVHAHPALAFDHGWLLHAEV